MCKFDLYKFNNSALILIDRDGGNQLLIQRNPSVHFRSVGFLFWFPLKREELGNENNDRFYQYEKREQ